MIECVYTFVLFDYAQFFAHFHEGGDALVEVFAFVAGRELHTDARLSLWHHWIANQRDGSFGLLWTNPDVDVLSFESFFVSLHCWNGFGG